MAKDERMPWQKNLGPAPLLSIPKKTNDPLWRVAEKLAQKLAVLQYVTDLQARPKPERQPCAAFRSCRICAS
jgi:hypothetical protein